MIRKILFLLLVLFPCKIFSQDSLLTLQEAIELCLKNNFDIQISSASRQQEKNNNTAGNAGMLPSLNLDGSYTKSSNSLKQKYNTSAEVNRDAAGATTMVADLGAEWTVFDGLRMFHTKEKLSQLSIQAEDQLKIQIENSLQELIVSYYSIVRHLQLLRSIQEELILSEERVRIADRKMNNGSGSRLDWLQVKTELNRQRSIEINLISEADAARIRLNQLMARNVESEFTVEDTVIISYKPGFEDLKESVQQQNNSLNYYRRAQKIARLTQSETSSLRYPVINLNAHYVFSKNTNEAGFILLNQQQGFNYGATATIPLFRGFNINRQIKNARLEVIKSELSYESAGMQINSDLYNAWRTFSNNLELLAIEEQNIGYAREVLSVGQERYRLGISNAIEQKEAVRTFEEAMTRLTDARFNAKISETILKKLNGVLVE